MLTLHVWTWLIYHSFALHIALLTVHQLHLPCRLSQRGHRQVTVTAVQPVVLAEPPPETPARSRHPRRCLQTRSSAPSTSVTSANRCCLLLLHAHLHYHYTAEYAQKRVAYMHSTFMFPCTLEYFLYFRDKSLDAVNIVVHKHGRCLFLVCIYCHIHTHSCMVVTTPLLAQVTEEQLATCFQECGQLVDCRICGDPNSPMRFAFIEFLEEAAVQNVSTQHDTAKLPP